MVYLWWEEMDSNHRSRKTTDLQSVAFGRSATLPCRKTDTTRVVPRAGIEPATQGFSVLCSTDWATEPLFLMAVPTGLEPAISSVTDWHVNHYTMEPFYGCGGRTWTNDLRVMSPTSYQLLYSAIYWFPVLLLGESWCRWPDLNRYGIATEGF